MICGSNLNKALKIRLWKASNCKEGKKKIILHGIFLLDSILIGCRPSILYFWIKNQKLAGKGIFSRSEPLFFIPNPCYNSLGKVGRKRRISEKFKFNYPTPEYLQINFLEISPFLKKTIIFTQFKTDINFLKKFILKFDLDYFFSFSPIRILLNKFLELRSGIKFSGNFLIYKKTKTFNLHDHSGCVLFFEDLYNKKITCVYCNNANFQLLDVQNRVRLNSQVSKFNVFFFGKYYLKITNFENSKIFVKNEVNLSRFVIH